MLVVNLVVRIDIDYDRCAGCKKCVKVCSYGVLGWFEDAPIVINPNGCMVCLDCINNCSINAISVKKK